VIDFKTLQEDRSADLPSIIPSILFSSGGYARTGIWRFFTCPQFAINLNLRAVVK